MDKLNFKNHSLDDINYKLYSCRCPKCHKIIFFEDKTPKRYIYCNGEVIEDEKSNC